MLDKISKKFVLRCKVENTCGQHRWFWAAQLIIFLLTGILSTILDHCDQFISLRLPHTLFLLRQKKNVVFWFLSLRIGVKIIETAIKGNVNIVGTPQTKKVCSLFPGFIYRAVTWQWYFVIFNTCKWRNFSCSLFCSFLLYVFPVSVLSSSIIKGT